MSTNDFQECSGAPKGFYKLPCKCSKAGLTVKSWAHSEDPPSKLNGNHLSKRRRSPGPEPQAFLNKTGEGEGGPGEGRSRGPWPVFGREQAVQGREKAFSPELKELAEGSWAESP